MALAVATGVPPGVWIEEGARAIATASELLRERDRPSRTPGPGGPQMSG